LVCPTPTTGTRYQQREQSIKGQLDDLKRASQEAFGTTKAWAKSQAQTTGRLSTAEDDAVTSLRARIEGAATVMSAGLVERDVEVRLLLLAALSGEHVLYIGPPGTAKSELGRRLSRLCRGNYFERLLTRFSVPEELFGPLSMRALEEDKYVRQTEGYLPEATVAFVDEIFKANSAILNTLLTVLNERLFDNGSKRVRVPLLCLVS
jgi:MoxR-like ATPase